MADRSISLTLVIALAASACAGHTEPELVSYEAGALTVAIHGTIDLEATFAEVELHEIADLTFSTDAQGWYEPRGNSAILHLEGRGPITAFTIGRPPVAVTLNGAELCASNASRTAWFACEVSP